MSHRTTAEVLESHRAAGRFITVEGLQTFVLEKGQGEPVLCLHGVPTSSFLYRKVIDGLAERGLRGISFDLPGLGFSDRPKDFDYGFSNLARFTGKVAETLGLDRYHLVVHDVGGPVGFALAADHRDRIRSLTILNTWIDVVNFKKPLPMRPFELPVAGEAELATINHLTWQVMWKGLGVADSEQIPAEERNAYVDLLKRDDGGSAFLKIMRSFDKSEAFRDRCYRAVHGAPYPIQAIWGSEDPTLTYDRYGKEVKRVAGLSTIHQVPAKHFLQEDQAPAIAERIAAFIHPQNQ
ncbi:pimeloyl-ACP methyl ester carboxylesterase [Lewinella marina]|uniref:Haloalkane dehalogenase n=1 Tax=Neolewinella marina TaxID=438751 RepID=A0A2G0CGH9_9BACT|nr:alpha/beta fold hydrolase [Neolewinella marina]NJB86472.1 pimeloyl-ACP methyl ester carboxylesterase [Neolewinella marina]PHK99068.1 haloalkane dehalogenase [Neolewinella marina]